VLIDDLRLEAVAGLDAYLVELIIRLPRDSLYTPEVRCPNFYP